MAEHAFYRSGIRNILIPRSIELLDVACFEGCDSLRLVAFEGFSSLHRIKRKVFGMCSFHFVCLPRTVTRIGSSSFSSCPFLCALYFEPGCVLQHIGDEAFFSSRNLMLLGLPRDVDLVDGSLLVDAPSLCLSLERNHSFLELFGDFLLELTENRIIRYCGRDSIVTVSNDIEAIAQFSFAMLPFLESVIFRPDSSLARIEDHAFEACLHLRRVYFPPSMEFLGNRCFFGCREIEYVKFSSLSHPLEIGEAAFLLCVSLKSIRIPSTVAFISQSCFEACYQLAAVDFESGSALSEIRSSAFARCSSLRQFCVPGTVLILFAKCFAGCANLHCFRFESGSQLTRIDKEAFVDCFGLVSMEFPASIAFLGESIFDRCPTLETLNNQQHFRIYRI
jgi:hypothetical protein